MSRTRQLALAVVMLVLGVIGFAVPASATDPYPPPDNNGNCPAGYSKIDYSGTLGWTSDGDYESVILVGGPPGDNNQDPDGRDKYFSDVEEGDVIARVAHNISHICVIPADPYEPVVTYDYEYTLDCDYVLTGFKITLTDGVETGREALPERTITAEEAAELGVSPPEDCEEDVIDGSASVTSRCLPDGHREYTVSATSTSTAGTGDQTVTIYAGADVVGTIIVGPGETGTYVFPILEDYYPGEITVVGFGKTLESFYLDNSCGEDPEVTYVTPVITTVDQTAVCVYLKPVYTSGSITFTDVAGLHYWLDGNEVSGTIEVEPGAYEISFTTDENVELAEGVSNPVTVTVLPADTLECEEPSNDVNLPPYPTPWDECGTVDDTWSNVPEPTEEYSVGIVGASPGASTVTLTANDGFVINVEAADALYGELDFYDGATPEQVSFTYAFTDEPCEEEPPNKPNPDDFTVSPDYPDCIYPTFYVYGFYTGDGEVGVALQGWQNGQWVTEDGRESFEDNGFYWMEGDVLEPGETRKYQVIATFLDDTTDVTVLGTFTATRPSTSECQSPPPPPPPPVVCPEGTDGRDVNGNGMIDDGECKTPPTVTPPAPPQGPKIVTDYVSDASSFGPVKGLSMALVVMGLGLFGFGLARPRTARRH